jgi:hypothetical protein
MPETWGRDAGSLEIGFWRAGCTERCLSGSGRMRLALQYEAAGGAASHEMLKVRVLSPLLLGKALENSQELFLLPLKYPLSEYRILS